MRNPDRPVGEFQLVLIAEVRVVISRDERGRRGVLAYKRGQLLPARGRVSRVSSRTGIKTVPVEDQPLGSGQERTQLRQAPNAAGMLAVVEVGKNAGDGAGHAEGSAE